jgi:folate-binding protein YgfZ
VPAPAAIDLDGQYRELREGKALLDRGARAKLVVRGHDGAEFLQGQLTNDVEALRAGEGCYAALLDRKGRVQADMRVLRFGPEELWLDTEPQAREPVTRHLRTYSIGREVEIEDISEDFALLSFIGPLALEEARDGGEAWPLHSTRAGGDGARLVATAEGYDVICAVAEAERHRAGVPEVSEEAVEILRIERGVPRLGREMTGETMPAEAGIVEGAVSFTKGCYIGQETVARLHYKGRPNRHLRGLRLSAPVAAGEPLRLEDREVGRVGSSCLSPALGPIALAIVRREAGPGDTLETEGGATAEVVELPFGAEA